MTKPIPTFLRRAGCGAVLLASALAWGHGALVQASPASGATVEPAATLVRLQFNEALEPAFSAINVKDSAGAQQNAEASRVDPADRHVMVVPLPALSPGDYGVYWSAVTQDGHRTKGSYVFTVK